MKGQKWLRAPGAVDERRDECGATSIDMKSLRPSVIVILQRSLTEPAGKQLSATARGEG